MFKNRTYMVSKKPLMFSGAFLQVFNINSGCVPIKEILGGSTKISRSEISKLANNVCKYFKDNYSSVVDCGERSFEVRTLQFNRIKILFNEKPFLISEEIDSNSKESIENIKFYIVLNGFNFINNQGYTLSEIINSLTALGQEYRFNKYAHFLKIRDTSRKLMGGKTVYLDIDTSLMYVIFDGYLSLCSSRNLDKNNNLVKYYPRTSILCYKNGKYYLSDKDKYTEESITFFDIKDDTKYTFNADALKSFKFVLCKGKISNSIN